MNFGDEISAIHYRRLRKKKPNFKNGFSPIQNLCNLEALSVSKVDRQSSECETRADRGVPSDWTTKIF